jgi:hypothetical protein
MENFLKGVWHEIFDLRFFHESVSTGPLSIVYHEGHFEFLQKFVEIFESKASTTPAIIYRQ